MNCQESHCSGKINLTNSVLLRTGCCFNTPAYACEKCGALHWADGGPVYNRPGDRAFLERGQVVHKKLGENLIN